MLDLAKLARLVNLIAGSVKPPNVGTSDRANLTRSVKLGRAIRGASPFPEMSS